MGENGQNLDGFGSSGFINAANGPDVRRGAHDVFGAGSIGGSDFDNLANGPDVYAMRRRLVTGGGATYACYKNAPDVKNVATDSDESGKSTGRRRRRRRLPGRNLRF